MRRIAALLLLLWPGLALAGAQVNPDSDSTAFFCEFAISDAAVAAGTDAGSCDLPGVTTGLLAVTSAAANWFVPTNRRLLIREYGVLVTAALAATEDCNLVLQTDTTTGGAGSTVSTLTTGPGATETECSTGSNIVDAVGESCVVNNFTSVVPGGGFWRIRWDDNDGGGANTCTNWQGGTIWIRGNLVPQ